MAYRNTFNSLLPRGLKRVQSCLANSIDLSSQVKSDFFCIAGFLASPGMLRFPSARGPNSMRPETNQLRFKRRVSQQHRHLLRQTSIMLLSFPIFTKYRQMCDISLRVRSVTSRQPDARAQPAGSAYGKLVRMIRSRLSFARFYLRMVTLLLPVCAYFVAVKLRFGFNILLWRKVPDLPSYWSVVLLTTVVWAIAAEESGLWNVEQLYAPRGKSRRLLEALAFTYGIVMAVGFLYRQATYSRLVIATSAVALFLMATGVRIAFRVFPQFFRKDGRNEAKILVVGTDCFARRVGTSLSDGEVLPCRVVGFVHLPGQEIAVDGPVYELEQVPSLRNGNSIDDIIVALPASRLTDVQTIVPTLGKLCVPTRVVIDLGDGVFLRDRLVDLGGTCMIDLQPTLAESSSYLIQKRIFDVAFSIFLLLLTLPITLLIAVCIKLESQGPIFFVQDRVGLNGRVFRMFKFRTMRVGSREEGDTHWTCAEDPRRTSLGSFLRRFSLDELPQFFNVLKGDMSIVGPRPERPYFVERFLAEIECYNSRQAFKAGITGWAQVNGWRGDTSIAKRVENDLYYLRNWSLTFDLQIITMTVLRIFTSKNAY
jgi:Undecaprenyl-phosphate glucose phosphotransferase